MHEKGMEKCEIRLRRVASCRNETMFYVWFWTKIFLFGSCYLWKLRGVYRARGNEYFLIHLHRPRFIFIGARQLWTQSLDVHGEPGINHFWPSVRRNSRHHDDETLFSFPPIFGVYFPQGTLPSRKSQGDIARILEIFYVRYFTLTWNVSSIITSFVDHEIF